MDKAEVTIDAVPTAGRLCPDGTIIELLQHTTNPGLALLRWKEGDFEIAQEVQNSGTRYAPLPIAPSVSRAVRFPKRIAPPETTQELFTDLHAFLSRHLGQLESCTTAIAFAIFASWLAPVLQAAPILSIFAPAGSPKNLTM